MRVRAPARHACQPGLALPASLPARVATAGDEGKLAPIPDDVATAAAVVAQYLAEMSVVQFSIPQLARDGRLSARLNAVPWLGRAVPVRPSAAAKGSMYGPKVTRPQPWPGPGTRRGTSRRWTMQAFEDVVDDMCASQRAVAPPGVAWARTVGAPAPAPEQTFYTLRAGF